MSDSRSDRAADGEWFAGDTAEGRRVRLAMDGDALTVLAADGATLATWPLRSVRIDAVDEEDVAHLESATDPGRVAVTGDVDFVRRLRAVGARGGGLPRGRRAVGLAVGCSGGVLAIFGGIYAAAPWISRRIAEQVPLSVERRMGSQLDDLLAKSTCETAPARDALARLKARLDPAGAIPASIRITNLSFSNAFSLPGGDVLLTRGLVEQAESPDEIAGVLAHELAHVRHRHVLSQLIENAFLSSMWTVTFGDYSGLLLADPRTVHQALTLRHSREAESEADATGADMLRAAHVSTAGLIDFLERNQQRAADKMSFLSTHPATAERVERLRSGVLPDGDAALDDPGFRAIARACAGRGERDSLSGIFE
ncbi:MAG TPA: M48 family metallopeptidase [Polyangiaceae bacterium]|nr:M48 family metallopeptidase [Polyangiaceae bacterium]